MRQALYLLLILIMFQSCSPYKKIAIIKLSTTDLFKPSKNDTIDIRTLSVIDRYWRDPTRILYKQNTPFLVKNRELSDSTDKNLIDQIVKKRKYEYSFSPTLKSFEGFIKDSIYFIKIDNLQNRVNDSIFKPLIDDSAFNKSFDTSFIKKIKNTLSDGLHLQITILRYLDPDIPSFFITFYVEFILVGGKKIRKYTCIEYTRRGVKHFSVNWKKHRWRIDKEDVRLIFKKLFEPT